MKLKALLLSMCLISNICFADTLILHTYTYHPKEQPWMQNKTPGLGYRTDDNWQLGVFCNSYSASKLHSESFHTHPRNCETSYYAAKYYSWEYTNLLIGAAKGYHRGPEIPLINAQLQPIIAPGISLGPIKINMLAPKTYHLSFESKL